MARIHPNHSNASRWLPCVAALAFFAGSARGQYDPDWASHFRIGGMVGLNIKADFKMSGNLGINHPPGVYDDGYVHPPPAGTADDATSNWGYTSGNQVSGQKLFMHDTTSFALDQNTSATKDGGAFPGIDLAYGGNLWYWGRVRIGWDFGFGFLPINISANQSAVPGHANQSIFSFDTGNTSVLLGGQPPFLAPGYQGTANPGPLIHSTSTLEGTTNISGMIAGSQTLDVMLYTFRLGPSFYLDFNQYLGMSLGAGPALGLVSGNLKFNQTITPDDTGIPTRSKGQVDGTDVVYGGYVNATLMYHVVRNGDVYLGVQYMPMSSATISGGGHQAKLDLGGQMYISAGINWPF